MDILINRLYEVIDQNASIFTNAGLEPVKHMDLYRGQTLNPEQFEIYELPALFFDYKIDWKKNGKNYQGEGTLEIHVVTDAPWETSNIYSNRQEGLKKSVYYKRVRDILDGVESKNTGKLIRLTERPVDTGVICYHMLTYTFSYSEEKDQNRYTLVSDGNPSVSGNLVKTL